VIGGALHPSRPAATVPAWHAADDGDALFGIEAIARYLALPFLDVRTMIGMRSIPTGKAGRSHTARRSTLARFMLDLERRDVPAEQIGPEPFDVGGDDALGLLSGQPAIAAYLSCSWAGVRHRRAALDLGVFWIGKTPFARRASVDRWQAASAGESRSSRRLATIHAGRVALAQPGALVGAKAVGEYLGAPPQAVFRAIYAGRLPAYRVGKGWAVDPATIGARGDQPHGENRHGQC